MRKECNKKGVIKMKKLIYVLQPLLVSSLFILEAKTDTKVTTTVKPIQSEHICKGNNDITFYFFYYSYAYVVRIDKELAALTQIKIQLDSGSAVNITEPTGVLIDKDRINNIFTFLLIRNVSSVQFTIKGRRSPNHPPYVISLMINGVENCENPERSYFHRYQEGVVKHYEEAPDKLCGRRKINRKYTELIVSGSKTTAGDWPWHAAVMRLARFALRYTCGGTLISKYLVLTAGHCVAQNGRPLNPQILHIILGKHALFTNDDVNTAQEKEVFQVIVPHDFRQNPLRGDIALLKLKTEAMYNNYVQPACIWFDGIYDHIGSYQVEGSVCGWGLDSTDDVSKELQTIKLPQVAHDKCIAHEPIFYSDMLMEGKTFCAGYLNGTSVCNGDSGGSFLVFVQDDLSPNYYPLDYTEGAWYVKGIVSASLVRHDAPICDPNSYTIFTDVVKYRDWILNHMT